jgi:predicted nucleic acid-binding protein
MRYLLDTGILVRLLHRADPDHAVIRDALRRLAERRHTFVAARQNIVEFWNVCTRPASARGGFGLTVEETAARLRMLERLVTVLNEPDSTYRHWKSLVVRHGVIGRQVHDTRIVAIMVAYRIKRVMTLNRDDFARFHEVEAVTPRDVAFASARRGR